jgi:hypothetical protein
VSVRQAAAASREAHQQVKWNGARTLSGGHRRSEVRRLAQVESEVRELVSQVQLGSPKRHHTHLARPPAPPPCSSSVERTRRQRMSGVTIMWGTTKRP